MPDLSGVRKRITHPATIHTSQPANLLGYGRVNSRVSASPQSDIKLPGEYPEDVVAHAPGRSGPRLGGSFLNISKSLLPSRFGIEKGYTEIK